LFEEWIHVAVKIRLKKFGRAHRPYFRMCAIDARSPRDGRVIEELGHYDPMLPETDARAQLNGERIDYWLGVGAQPTEKAAVLIKKYGTSGSHLKAQEEALARLGQRKQYTPAEPAPAAKPAAASEGESTEAAAEG
jgi:small subunit ribosomal protein S16